MPTITKQYNNRVHSSTKGSPIEASLKKNEGYVYRKLLHKRERKPKLQVNDLVRTANLKNAFSRGDSSNWSYQLYKFTEIVNDKISSYRIDNLLERYNAALLKKTALSVRENKDVMKKLNIT